MVKAQNDYSLCAHCGKPHQQNIGHVNRARNGGRRIFCNRVCAGLGRRKHKTKAQKVEEKRIYDAEYRAKNLQLIKRKKHAYFKRIYDPKKAAIERKKRMKKHVEYCRTPRYKAWKRDYDKRYVAANPHRSLHLPKFAPLEFIDSIRLLKLLRKEQKREHK